MQILHRRIPSLWAVIWVTGLSACTQSPNLAPVEASFAKGTAGFGASQPERSLTSSEFGKRIKKAVETSPNFAQSTTRLDIAAANEDAANGGFRPRISLGLNTRAERGDTNMADVNPFIRVSQLIYDGGATSGEVAAAQARVLESRGGQLQTASETTLAAIEAYIIVLNRRSLIDIFQENVVLHQRLVQQISKRTVSGAGSRADVLTAKSRLADAQTRRADAKARAELADARFREVFGMSPGVLPPPVVAPQMTRTEAEIVAGNPQVRSAKASVLAARAELATALAGRRPHVRASAFADHDSDNDANYGVDFSINYELDSTGQRRASITAAEARVQETEYILQSLTRAVMRDLDSIRADQTAGAQRVKAARLAAQANAENIVAAQAQFSIGRRSLIEILDAQQDYVNAQERLILAEQNFFLTNYAVLSLTGEVLDLFGIKLDEGTQFQ